MGQKRYEISDDQWEQLKDMFQYSKMGNPTEGERLMLNAIWEITSSGARWSDRLYILEFVSLQWGLFV